MFKHLERLVLPARAFWAPRKRDGHESINLAQLGFLPGIAGADARGFNQLGDVITQTADGRDLNDLWAIYQQTLQLYNAQRDALLRILTFPVTQVVEDVLQGGDQVNFEEASEFGLPRGVRTTRPTYFSLAYSWKWWDVGIRYTWMYLAETDARQVDALHNAVLEADNRNQFNEVMKALFNNTTRTANIQQQAYNVYPLYNGDSTIPPPYKGTTPGAPHNHYLVSGATSLDPGDFDDAEATLKHHGYSWQTGTAMVALINSANIGPVSAFRVGTNGAKYDFTSAAGTPGWQIPAALLMNTQDQAPPSVWNGLPVLGRYGPWLIIEEDLVPVNYVLFLASGGSENARNPVGFREHANATLRGLRLVKGPNPDYPLVDSEYNRGFGTGIRQRGAAVITQLKASGSYDIPSGMTYP